VHGRVVAVHRSGEHSVSKRTVEEIELIEGVGVAGDAHAGASVQHRSRVARDPTQPNLRQVHLMHAELLEELTRAGFDVGPGAMGENVTTRDIDLLALARGTQLRVGRAAVIEITGLRYPCVQLEGVQQGLQSAVLDRDADGNVVRKAGVMAVVLASGSVTADDAITISHAPARHVPLTPV
jgi:MOSC domain-containing protein YiiM